MTETPIGATDSDDENPYTATHSAVSTDKTITVVISETPTAPTDSGNEEPTRATDLVPHYGPNNENALSHGATSERKVGPLAAEIARELISQHPRLGEAENREALLTYARLTAQCELLDRFLDEHGLLDDNGRVRGAANFKSRLEPVRWRALDAMGLTPSSAARLARDNAAKNKDIADFSIALARFNAARDGGRQ